MTEQTNTAKRPDVLDASIARELPDDLEPPPALPPALWADVLSEYIAEVQRRAYIPVPPDKVAKELLRLFRENVATLPLRNLITGLKLPANTVLTDFADLSDFDYGTIMRTGELRAWAKEHAPDLLGSPRLAVPASSAQDETDAGTGTPAEQWKAARGNMQRRAELAVSMVKACQNNKAKAARILGTSTGPLYRALMWAKENAPASVAPGVAGVVHMYAQLAGKPDKT